jgi:hypothetical protein
MSASPLRRTCAFQPVLRFVRGAIFMLLVIEL